MASSNKIKSFTKKHLEKAICFLGELIQFPSISGCGEKEIQNFIFKKFSKFGKAELKEIPDYIKQDPEFSFGENDLDYSERKNLVLHIPSSAKGRSLILNTHSDVVPAENWSSAFTPKIKETYISGRGACDAKGQIATIYLSLLVLKDMQINLSGDLIIEIVIEEEIGGNGTLALVRDGNRADGVLVLEPTGLKILPSAKGALWYKLEIEGKPVHMGKIAEGISAIEKTCFIIRELKKYEKKLIEESKNVALYEDYTHPAQVNFGIIKGGEYPSMVCGKVILEGGIGFLPNKNLAQVKEEFEEVIKNCGDTWIQKHYKLNFSKLHNDACAISKDHPLVQTMISAAYESGLNPEIAGFTASSDGRLFNKLGKMPVIIFGPGELGDAHSNSEKIDMNQIEKASEILVRAIMSWCVK